MSDKTGKMRKTIISTDLDEPRAIVVNPLDGYIFQINNIYSNIDN